jgi:hypothetical protein
VQLLRILLFPEPKAGTKGNFPISQRPTQEQLMHPNPNVGNDFFFLTFYFIIIDVQAMHWKRRIMLWWWNFGYDERFRGKEAT